MMNPVRRHILALLSGLALGSLAAVHAQNVTTNLISQTTFDPDAPAPWSYGYYYSDNGLGYQENERAYYLPDDVDMTNAVYRFSFDLSSLAGMTGYGNGTGAPLFRAEPDPQAFVSTNREDYIFSFAARAEGFDAGQTSANGEMQVQFYYRDAENTELKLLQVNVPFVLTADWKRYTLNLGEGGLGDNTSESTFAQHNTEISDVRFNLNLHEPHTAFGYDADNTVYLDNMTLEVVDKPAVTSVPMHGVTMAEWNFDDKLVDNEYHYEWSQNDFHAVPTAGNNAGGNDPNTLGENDSSGWFLTLDTTEFNNSTPQWAGGGSGGGGAVDYTQFNTNDLAMYRISFDARVLGLAEDKTNTAATLQLFLDAPDDTLQPADEDTEADAVIRLDFPISQVSPNWQNYSFLLSKGGVGSGTKENFAAAVPNISALRTQWQIENAASLADWGFDADNTLVIDNFKLERLYPDTGEMTIHAARAGDQLVLTWDAGAGNVTLQSATSVSGPYADVSEAANGYSTAMTGQAQFFRLVRKP